MLSNLKSAKIDSMRIISRMILDFEIRMLTFSFPATLSCEGIQKEFQVGMHLHSEKLRMQRILPHKLTWCVLRSANWCLSFSSFILKHLNWISKLFKWVWKFTINNLTNILRRLLVLLAQKPVTLSWNPTFTKV